MNDKSEASFLPSFLENLKGKEEKMRTSDESSSKAAFIALNFMRKSHKISSLLSAWELKNVRSSLWSILLQ